MTPLDLNSNFFVEKCRSLFPANFLSSAFVSSASASPSSHLFTALTFHHWQCYNLIFLFCCCLEHISLNQPTGPIRSSSRDVSLYVCLCVCLSPFHVLDFEASFAPTSRSRMSKFFGESLGKSAGKKRSQNWTFLLGSGLKSPRKQKVFFADFHSTWGQNWVQQQNNIWNLNNYVKATILSITQEYVIT